MQKCFRPAFRFALRPSKGVPAISRPVRPIHSFLSSNRSFTNAVSAATLQCGQPVHETHPHLLKAGERKSRYSFERMKLHTLISDIISNARYHRSRICATALEARRQTARQVNRRTLGFGSKVSVWSCLFRIQPRSRLLLPNWSASMAPLMAFGI